jgi:hypothetical protein
VDFARDVPDVERARDVPDPDRERDVVPPEERFAAVVRPPLLPAAFFCAAERLEVERDELREVVEPERDRLDEADPERDRLVPLDLLDLLDLRGVAARTREMVSSLCGCCGCSPSLASSSGCGE